MTPMSYFAHCIQTHMRTYTANCETNSTPFAGWTTSTETCPILKQRYRRAPTNPSTGWDRHIVGPTSNYHSTRSKRRGLWGCLAIFSVRRHWSSWKRWRPKPERRLPLLRTRGVSATSSRSTTSPSNPSSDPTSKIHKTVQRSRNCHQKE